MRLSPQHVTYFDTFGFLTFPGLFAAEIASIAEAFEATWVAVARRTGKEHDGQTLSSFVPFADQTERLSALLDDPRIDGIASALLGDDYNYFTSDGNYYVGDTNWHSDGWRPHGNRVIKMAFYLDPAGRDTGCLRVIPGSHHTGDVLAARLQEHLGRCQETWGIHGRDVPAVAVETQPGDLVLFDQNLKHASFGGGTRRRMFTLNFTARYTDENMAELKEFIAKQARYEIDHLYGETMLRTAGETRMRHLEQVMANEGHLAELSRQARERRAERETAASSSSPPRP